MFTIHEWCCEFYLAFFNFGRLLPFRIIALHVNVDGNRKADKQAHSCTSDGNDGIRTDVDDLIMYNRTWKKIHITQISVL
jgi:hypothetical protein